MCPSVEPLWPLTSATSSKFSYSRHVGWKQPCSADVCAGSPCSHPTDICGTWRGHITRGQRRGWLSCIQEPSYPPDVGGSAPLATLGESIARRSRWRQVQGTPSLGISRGATARIHHGQPGASEASKRAWTIASAWQLRCMARQEIRHLAQPRTQRRGGHAVCGNSGYANTLRAPKKCRV